MAVIPVNRDLAGTVGVVRVDDGLRITELVEKPQTDPQLAALRTPAAWMTAHGIVPRDREYLANMGIYVFRREALFDLLQKGPEATDLVRHVLARFLASHQVQAHLFDGYWED